MNPSPPLSAENSPSGSRSEEHTSEPSHGYISYAVFCLKKKKTMNPIALYSHIENAALFLDHASNYAARTNSPISQTNIHRAASRSLEEVVYPRAHVV